MNETPDLTDLGDCGDVVASLGSIPTPGDYVGLQAWMVAYLIATLTPEAFDPAAWYTPTDPDAA